jgi:large subunit ribosomal protein L2
MPVKQYKPTSSARRFGSVNAYAEVTRTTPEKCLLEPLKKTGGRNHHGIITAHRVGGGNKRMYRKIDFRRTKDGVPAIVQAIEYDPNRSAFIALLYYADGAKSYILAPQGLNVGDKVESGIGVEPKPGNAMPVSHVPVGYEIHNIEVIAGRGGKMVRAAGGVARLIGREGATAHIQLPSGEVRMISVECRATIGSIGNGDHSKIKIGKAGRKRHMGIRPRVRAIAMNPVDHPMGGGEGRSKSGKHPCSKTGVLAKGGKTRKRGKASNKMIIRRRRSRRYGQLSL